MAKRELIVYDATLILLGCVLPRLLRNSAVTFSVHRPCCGCTHAVSDRL